MLHIFSYTFGGQGRLLGLHDDSLPTQPLNQNQILLRSEKQQLLLWPCRQDVLQNSVTPSVALRLLPIGSPVLPVSTELMSVRRLLWLGGLSLSSDYSCTISLCIHYHPYYHPFPVAASATATSFTVNQLPSSHPEHFQHFPRARKTASTFMFCCYREYSPTNANN